MLPPGGGSGGATTGGATTGGASTGGASTGGATTGGATTGGRPLSIAVIAPYKPQVLDYIIIATTATPPSQWSLPDPALH